MYRLLLLSLLISGIAAKSQTPEIPSEAKPFVLNGFEVLDYQTGDINGDKKPDAILILKTPGEDSIIEDETTRPLLVLVRQPDGKLKQLARNDNVILCRHCGGVFGDPYEGINITGNGFSISFYGGSSWRWGATYDFIYKPNLKNWVQAGESHTSFHAGDPETTMKSTVIGADELGLITLDKFNSDFVYEDSKWKVIAAKTFFYDNPKLGSKPRKAYLLKGNMATGIRRFKNFVEVSYENAKGEITTGYILKKDLVVVK